MKKVFKFLGIIAIAAVIVFSMTTCDDSGSGGSGGSGKGRKKVVDFIDISKQSKWDYMIAGDNGEFIIFNVNKSNNIPTQLCIKPKKDSDTGATLIFKENGLLDKMVINDHIFCYTNYKGYKFDMAVIKPDGTIEYHFDMETETNWDNVARSVSSINYGSARLTGHEVLSTTLDLISHGFGIASCVTMFAMPGFALSCATYLVDSLADYMLGEVYGDDYPIVKEVYDRVQDVLGCLNKDLTNCVSLLIEIVNVFFDLDQDLIQYGKFEEIEEAIDVLNGDYRNYDIKVTLFWEKGGVLQLLVTEPSGFQVCPASPDWDELPNENGYVMWGSNSRTGAKMGSPDGGMTSPFTTYWPKGKAPAGTYKVKVMQYSAARISDCKVRIYAFGRCKTYAGKAGSTLLDPSKYFLIATFDKNGIYGSDN